MSSKLCYECLKPMKLEDIEFVMSLVDALSDEQIQWIYDFLGEIRVRSLVDVDPLTLSHKDENIGALIYNLCEDCFYRGLALYLRKLINQFESEVNRFRQEESPSILRQNAFALKKQLFLVQNMQTIVLLGEKYSKISQSFNSLIVYKDIKYSDMNLEIANSFYSDMGDLIRELKKVVPLIGIVLRNTGDDMFTFFTEDRHTADITVENGNYVFTLYKNKTPDWEDAVAYANFLDGGETNEYDLGSTLTVQNIKEVLTTFKNECCPDYSSFLFYIADGDMTDEMYQKLKLLFSTNASEFNLLSIMDYFVPYFLKFPISDEKVSDFHTMITMNLEIEKIMQKRSEKAVELDLSIQAENLLSKTVEGFEKWKKNPTRNDLVGIDDATNTIFEAEEKTIMGKKFTDLQYDLFVNHIKKYLSSEGITRFISKCKRLSSRKLTNIFKKIKNAFESLEDAVIELKPEEVDLLFDNFEEITNRIKLMSCSKTFLYQISSDSTFDLNAFFEMDVKLPEIIHQNDVNFTLERVLFAKYGMKTYSDFEEQDILLIRDVFGSLRIHGKILPGFQQRIKVFMNKKREADFVNCAKRDELRKYFLETTKYNAKQCFKRSDFVAEIFGIDARDGSEAAIESEGDFDRFEVFGFGY